jgi:NOL1/NOP2/sun family putative RNA methylase
MTKRPKKTPEPKEEFIERMKEILPNEKDRESYWNILKIPPLNSIRCNTLKISPEKLIEKLEKKGWKVSQPWKTNPEVMIIESDFLPGELGRSLEHLLGYYYIQELSSMLPMIAMTPKENETYLDLCAAPGSKTTQAAASMKNSGTIIANEMSMGRMRILAANLERCGATNTIITRKEGRALCKNLGAGKINFDKILVDAPCSGEGTLRSSLKTYSMWNPKTIFSLSHLQKQLFENAFERLKVGGTIVYSTCTHAPEENEEVVSHILEKLKDKIEILPIEIPVKTRPGITKWKEKNYDKRVKLCARVYPHDNNTEGFFISKFKRIN